MTVSEVQPSWVPSRPAIEKTAIAAFMKRYGVADLADLLHRADAEPKWYWRALLDFFDIRFATQYSDVLDLSHGNAWPRWCVDGTTNIVLNCLDRHRETSIWNKAAIIFEGEDDKVVTWTYAELDDEVRRLASSLLGRGIKRGDSIGLFMPMVPEAAAAVLAIVKIGAVVVPLFSGFGPEPIATRLNDAKAAAVITADISWRRGKPIHMLATLEQALVNVPTVHSMVVLPRGTMPPAASERQVRWPTADRQMSTVPTEIVEAEAPAMLLYTSGTTGMPKGTIHTHCGVLAKNALDMGLCIDLGEADRLLWMSDMGWIVGPKVVISTTLLGATMILVEGTPDYPHEARMLKVAAKHRATIMGIVPTTVRQMMRHDPSILKYCDLPDLRATISIGEPWTPDAWCWFFDNVCRKSLPILNYAGGTECGGAILISSFLQKLRPCAFGHPVPGCGADIVDRDGRSLPPGEMGELVMRRPSIGLTRGLWQAPERYLNEYWNVIPGVWVQGDLASRDTEGLWYLHGRSDDTIKISGKRTGPAEIETVLLSTGSLADCAVVGLPDPVSGTALAAVCVPLAQGDDPPRLASRLSDAVGARFGQPYRPKEFIFVTELPKTRNSKTMRRVIRSALTDKQFGDLSSLANPTSIEEIQAAARVCLDKNATHHPTVVSMS
jgi:acetyl-CoA synthetase